MKSLLLITFMFLSSLLFGQKKLISETNHYFDPNGQLYQKDSLAYHYGSWIGSLNQFKYDFRPGWDGITDFQKNTPSIACDSIESFNGTTASFSPYYISYNSLNADKVLSTNLNWSTNTQSQTSSFTYNSSGNLQMIVTDYFDSGIYLYSDSTTYNYNGLGNRINSLYSINSIANLTIIDTTEYLVGTNKIAHFVQYSNSAIPGNPLTKVFENFTHYSGNQIDYVDVWNTYTSPTCVWNSRKKYLYNSTGLYSTQTYPVSGGVLATIPEFKTLFSYHTNGEPEVFSYFQYNAVTGKDSLEYDSDGFITKIKIYGGNTLYLSKIQNYYFQNTLSLPVNIDFNVSIFPNPTSQFAEIKTAGQLKNVEVYNNKGQLLIHQNTNKIDLSRLENGMYILKGNTDLGSFTENIIKE